jgi:hypothetical protein
MKQTLKTLFIGCLLLFGFKGFSQQASVDFDSTYQISFGQNKILINGQFPANITIFNQRKIVFDISNSSLTGLDLYISTTPDYPMTYSFPTLNKAIVKSGSEGSSGAKLTIDILAAKEATGNEFHPILYLCSKQKTGAFTKFYVFNRSINQNFSFVNNQTFRKIILPRDFKTNYSNEVGNLFVNVENVFAYSPFLIVDDLNNDKVDDFVMATNSAFFQGKTFSTGGMFIPLYKYLTKDSDKNIIIKSDNEDMSYPNSKPSTLFHNIARASIIDLNGDGKKEIIGWGEGYHQSPDPLLPEFAKNAGLKENIDFQGSDNAGAYNKLMYLKKLTFYEIVNGKLVDRRNLVPNEIPLSASINGSAGDIDKDGDNDIVIMSEGVWTMINQNYQFTLKKIVSNDFGDFMKEGFQRRISTILPYLIDINQDGYGDLVFSLEKSTGITKPNRIVYVLNNKNQGFDFENVKDLIPYNESSSKDNYLNYVLSDVYAEDINKNGTQEIVFCFAKEFSTVDNEAPFPSQQFYRIIEIGKTGTITDQTSAYFEGTSNNIKVSSKNGGNFFLKNIDDDPELEIIPYFNTYDPTYYSFFPKDGWYGYWNNYAGFQYFDFIENKYRIRRIGNIQRILDDNSSGKINAVKIFEPNPNSNIFFHDFDKDGKSEILITGSNSDQLWQPTADFQFNSGTAEVKENTALNVEIDSIAIPTSLNASNFTFSLLEENAFLGLKNNKIYIKSAIDFETISNKKITLPIKVTNTKYNTYSLMERVYTVTDVAETVILGTLEERGGRITPNPFSRQIQVDFPAELGKVAEVQVVDLQGKQYDSTREISSGEILDLSYLSPGTYFLRVESLDHRQVFSQKLVKIP